MHRRRPPCCLSFCLAKRSEFRTAWPITSSRSFSTIAVWRIPYGGVLSLREGALGEHTRPEWSSWSHAPPHTSSTQAAAWHHHNQFYLGWVFGYPSGWFVKVDASMMTSNILDHAALNVNPQRVAFAHQSWVQGPRNKWSSVGVRRLAVSSSGLVTTGKIGGRGFPPTTD